jgi:hypothetical protein
MVTHARLLSWINSEGPERLDATTEGPFLSLTLGKAKILMENIVDNQSWSLDNTQHYHQSEETIEQVNALSTKMDDLLN